MDAEKKKRLEAAGFEVGTVAEFLDLTPQESALIEARIALARLIKEHRKGDKLTQAEAAGIVGTSQGRLARIEAADASVSLDLLFKAALATGASLTEIGAALAAATTV